jgi:hypothetical protein
VTAFTDWLADIATDRVVLAELQPAEHLTAWTAVGGATPLVYSTPWPAFIQEAVVPGGVYRRLDAVRQNDVPLIARASVALVNANPGSFFFDQAVGLLYVSTSTGSSPLAFDAMMALFSLFVATQAKDFVGGLLYEPYLTGSLPVVDTKAEDPFTPVKTMVTGTLELVNAHSYLDGPFSAYIWRNRAVTLHLGGGALARADYEPIASMRIDALTVSDERAVIQVRSLTYLLERNLPLNLLTANEYPYLAEGVEGTYKPLLYGLKRDMPAPCVDAYHRRTANFEGQPWDYADVYLVADPAATPLTSVLEVYAVSRSDGGIRGVPASAYGVNLAACTVTITDAAWRADQWEIRVTATGKSDGGSGYLQTFGAIARDVLLLLGELPENIDDSTFAAADALAPFALGLWVREYQQATAIIKLLQQSVIGSVHTGSDGRWRARVLDLSLTSTTAVLQDEDFAAWHPVDRIDPLYPVVRVFFDRSPSSGEALLTTAEDAATRYLYETSDGLSVETALVDRSDSVLMAQRYRLLSTRPDLQVDVELRGLELMTAELYDQVVLSRRRAPGGPITGERWEILALTKALNPVQVHARIGNQGGIAGLADQFKAWADDAAPDTYLLSGDSDRGTLMYWADDNDEVSAGVASTSVWW